MSERVPSNTAVMDPTTQVYPPVLEGHVVGNPKEGLGIDDLKSLLAASDPAEVSFAPMPAVEVAPTEVSVVAPETAPVEIPVSISGQHRAPEQGGRHRTPESVTEYAGRHRVAETTDDATNEFSVNSIVSRLSAENQPAASQAAQERRSARVLARMANFAANRRTTREVARDSYDSARGAVRRTGSAVVGSAVKSGNYLKTNLKTGIEADKRNIQQTRDALVTSGRSARAHKDVLVASIKSRMGKIAEGTRSGAEKTARAAKVGANVLKNAGLVSLGADAMIVEAIGKGTKHVAVKTAEKTSAGASRVSQEVKQTVNHARENVADLRLASSQAAAQRAKAKAVRKADKFEARALRNQWRMSPENAAALNENLRRIRGE